MKKIFSLLLAVSAFACTQEKVVEITISNPSTTDRTNEITEITSDAIAKLKGETFIISDNTGSQVPNEWTILPGKTTVSPSVPTVRPCKLPARKLMVAIFG